MKTILLTGSNGFIGKFIKEFGNFRNYKIIYGTTSNTSNKEYVMFDKLYANVSSILKDKNIDIIIHCASIIPNSFESSDQKLFFDNMKMMANLYEFSIEQKIDKFIYLSSFGSMQNPQEYDIKDYYTLSKITGEHMCSIMQGKGIESASLRISSPFGEFYHKNNVLSLFIDLALKNKPITIYGTGNREQNFVYAGNIVEYIDCCLNHKISGVYDVVSQTNISMKELARTIVKLSDSKSVVELGCGKDSLEDIKLPIYNIGKAEKINYKDKYSFEGALKKYIQYRKGLMEK